MVSTKRLVLSAAALFAVPGFLSAQVTVDKDLPEYKPVQGVSGSLKSVGSDTMNNEMTLWAEGFLRHYPNVKIEIEGKGSSTAPPALIAGTSQFGPMSRAGACGLGRLKTWSVRRRLTLGLFHHSSRSRRRHFCHDGFCGVCRCRRVANGAPHDKQ